MPLLLTALLAALLASPDPGAGTAKVASVRVVAAGGIDAPYPSLGEAVAAAPEGATVVVGEGELRERIVLKRPLTLAGAGVATRLVAPEGAGPVITIRGANRVSIHDLTLEGGDIGIAVDGGSGHLVRDVALSGMRDSALATHGAELTLQRVSIDHVDVDGRGIDIDGGEVLLQALTIREGGRRAVQVRAARATLDHVDVEGSGLSALQVVDDADVRVIGGAYRGIGGAALYVGGARLVIDSAVVEASEFAVVAFRGAGLWLRNARLSGYRVAAVAMINSSGAVEGCEIERGGTEAAISVVGNGSDDSVALNENRIRDPGPFGIHVTQSRVRAKGNVITGARLDRERDMGDAFYAVDATLALEDNVLRGNAGSGVVTVRSRITLDRNGLIENGRAGVLLLESSHATATSNYFKLNRGAGVEVAEGAYAQLVRNRFGEHGVYDIDTGCGRAAGSADVGAGNTFFAAPQRRVCP